jgi:hypothetical protein
MPTELSEVTEVRLFARPIRISELSRYPDLQAPLHELSASSRPGGEMRRALVEGFFLAWSELVQPEQVVSMSQLLQCVQNKLARSES